LRAKALELLGAVHELDAALSCERFERGDEVAGGDVERFVVVGDGVH
jgi:hypothetical protein